MVTVRVDYLLQERATPLWEVNKEKVGKAQTENCGWNVRLL